MQIISRKDEQNTARILRDYTFDTHVFGVKIESELYGDIQTSAEMPGAPTKNISKRIFQIGVTNLSEIPCRVSSDLHESCNELAAVSTSNSVKL